VDIVETVKIVRLPGLPEHEDVSWWLEQGHDKRDLLEQAEAAPVFVDLLYHADPMHSARALIDELYTSEADIRILQRYRADHWLWNGAACYRSADNETIQSDIWRFLEKSSTTNKEAKTIPFKPNKGSVANVLEATNAICQLDRNLEVPVWLDDEDPAASLPAHEFMAVANGLLHLPTRQLYPPTPAYFGLSATEVSFDPAAPQLAHWLKFLKEVLVDQEAINVLQEWFGYTLGADTSQQKIMLCIGPKRSGKGTVARVHTALLGKYSVAGPTMSSLSQPFGLEPLIPKPLAIISDARIGQKTDKSTIVERLLSVSGEDTLTVGRKFKGAWSGRLPTRFMILTNEMPSLSDGSGALVSRFLVLLFPNSFYGNEDVALTDRLLTELPGILNWAMDGYQRLRVRGHFVQPQNAVDVIDEMEMLGAPVKAFVHEYCSIGHGQTVKVDDLYLAWENWCNAQGIRDAGTKLWFGRNLRSAVPGLKVTRPRAEAKERERIYLGIKLNVRPDEIKKSM
jgi:putative DNA primase/helicase